MVKTRSQCRRKQEKSEEDDSDDSSDDQMTDGDDSSDDDDEMLNYNVPQKRYHRMKRRIKSYRRNNDKLQSKLRKLKSKHQIKKKKVLKLKTKNKNNQKLLNKLLKPKPKSIKTRETNSGFPKIRIYLRCTAKCYFTILPPLCGRLRKKNYMHLSSLAVWEQILCIYRNFGYVPSGLSLATIKSKATCNTLKGWKNISTSLNRFVNEYNEVIQHFPPNILQATTDPPELSTDPVINKIRTETIK